MISFNDDVNKLHAAYCEATGFEVPMAPAYERVWLDVSKSGLSPDDVKLIVKGRIKRNATLNYKMSMVIHRIFGDEEAVAIAMNELAEIRATMRKPVYDAGKIAVLKATNRPTEPKQADARHVSEVFERMRKQL